ncbi:MAG: FtsX-like permease family protein [Clostridia bacterium]|nr:FtsX-like permease family protein [Clostridia bacterium]
MKRLTIQRIAGASLRGNRRAYMSLAAGLFLSVFLISTMCMSIHAIALAMRAQTIEQMGYEHTLLYASDMTDDELRAFGWFDQIGHVRLLGELKKAHQYIGVYDETAEELLNRQFIEGRMPETAGEIAMEETLLEMLELDVRVGDTVELNIVPIAGAEETRAFTLTGIMRDQSARMSLSSYYSFPSEATKIMEMPALLVSAGEPPFHTGTIATQRVMTLKRWYQAETIMRRIRNDALDLSVMAMVSPFQGELNTDIMYSGSGLDNNIYVVCIAMLGAALLLVCGVGIAGAMESRLTQRVEQIGFLRAVGATRRQLRRIYGQEAWMLALAVSPVSIAASCVAVALGAKAFPSAMVFRPSPLLLMPVFLFSVLCILLSANLPLRRASRISPMQVLRDTQMQRRMNVKRSQMRFRPQRLISMRKAMRHKGRMAMPALLTGLMLGILQLAGIGGANANLSHTAGEDFMINGMMEQMGTAFCYPVPERPLSNGDIAQLKAIPDIRSVSVKREEYVTVALNNVGVYLQEVGGDVDLDEIRTILGYPTGFLNHENGYVEEYEEDYYLNEIAVQKALQTEEKVVGLPLYIMDIPQEAWKAYLSDGAIRMDKIDSGEELLIYAPDFYTKRHSDGSISFSTTHDRGSALTHPNDTFYAGQTLELAQFLRDMSEYFPNQNALWTRYWPQTMEEWQELYDGAECRRASAKIGGVLGSFFYEFWTPCLITTEKGAQALGLNMDNVSGISIAVNQPISLEREEVLEARIKSVAARAGLTTFNRMKSRRESARNAWVAIMTFVSVGVVFLAAAVGLISGSLRRSVLADTRAIGTLRAVGANERILRGCYRGRIFASLLLGVAVNGALILCMVVSDVFDSTLIPWLFLIGVSLFALMISALACELSLRRSIRSIAQRSIIENIREL